MYVLEPDRANLVLAATVGLRPESVGQVRMRITEGLAGLVAEQAKPVVVPDASAHPRFKYFRDIGEDPYRTFLGVPVMDRGVLQGVLVVQTTEPRVFGEDDVRMLATAGVQLAPIVSEARTEGQFVAPVHRRLAALARNLWWSWDAESVALFRDLDPVLWQWCDHNPIALLQQIDVHQLEVRATQLALHGRINHAYRRMQEYLQLEAHVGRAPCQRPRARGRSRTSRPSSACTSRCRSIRAASASWPAIISRAPPISASRSSASACSTTRAISGSGSTPTAGSRRSTSTPITGVLPMEPAMADGVPVTVDIDTRTGRIAARVWRTAVGRNTLLLLDSNVEGNSPEDRELTARLYGGDQRVRIRQELLLGIGGVKALAALGISPGVVHLNEGHSAFASLELVRRRMEIEGINFDEAMRRVSSHVVFTTHTPVPAGHDRFGAELIEEHLGPVRDALGLSHEGLLALGRVNPHDWREEFCMTVLALKSSHRANAVSSLHGHVSRAMWTGLFPGVREEHIPIGHVTNGVHVNSWLAPQMRLVYERHLGRGLAGAQR